ncbi:MAG: hypothetical protein HGA48_02105 [Candidatus Yonathbacteria bacterium]|nr:hypothetical protein [Candidatus Yonathbacteria bacterium]
MKQYPYTVLLNKDKGTFPKGMAATFEYDEFLRTETVRFRRVFPDGRCGLSDSRLSVEDVFALAKLCLDNCEKGSSERKDFERLFGDVLRKTDE